MKDLSILKNIHQYIIDLLKTNIDLKQYVTNIYDIIPTTLSIPYIKIYLHNCKSYHTFSNSILEINLECEIYSYNMANILYIINTINNTLNSATFKYANYECKLVSSGNCNIKQYKKKEEIFFSLLNFKILAK